MSSQQELVHRAILAQLPLDIKTPKDFKGWVTSPLVWLTLGAIFIVLLNLAPSKPKQKLANSSWGSPAELAVARRKAKKQIANPTRNKVSLYINLDPDLRKKTETFWQEIGWKNPVKAVPKKREKGEPKPTSDNKIPTFYVPDAQRSIYLSGSAGSGKTFSVGDPLYRSAVDQGHPLIVYDFKYPEQSQRIAAYASVRGYKVEVFAPGYDESCTCNPTSFIRDEDDSIAAAQLAKTINANMNMGDGKKDEFFEAAGNALIEGILLLTKAIPKLLVKLDSTKFADSDGKPNELAKSYDDLMTAQSLLSLPDVAKRLAQAKERKIIPAWTGLPLRQTISVKDAEKTVSSIVATACAVFSGFIRRDFISAFVGKTNIPERIEGKTLMIFGLDNINRDIISPVLASILHMTVRNNIYGKIKRTQPLIVGLDEIATMRLPSLVNWLAEGREMGFCGILGVQLFNQLEKTYGKEVARTIFGNCATKFIFNPQENEAAKMFAEMLGETEITYYTKGNSNSSAKGGGSSSTSKNEQRTKKYLFEPAQFTRLKRGRCVVINPNYERGDEAYLPILQSIEIRQEEIAHQEWSVENWETVINHVISQRSQRNRNSPNYDEELRQMLIDRDDLAKVILPLETATK